ncbi:MAG: hypothetical protein ABIU10_04525 [Sphingomicrobium sp.]
MTDTLKEDIQPLLDPTELAGTADAAIAAEFAARDAIEALDAAEAEAQAEAEAPEPAKSDDLPLDGE